MKRFYFILLAVVVLSVSSFAQTGGVSIGKDGQSADPSAILELVSTTKGLLIPRMTSAQRNEIAAGVSGKGLMVYDTSQNAFFFWDGSAWKTVASANARVVNGIPTGAGVTGELAFDAQNPALYIYSGTAWVKAGGGAGTAVFDPSWENQTLYLGSQDGKIVKIGVTAKNVKVEANSTIGMPEMTVQAAIEKAQKADGVAVTPTTDISSTNVQSALVELQSDINTLKVSTGLKAISTDNSTIIGDGTLASPLKVNAINSAQIVNGAVTLNKIFSNNEFNKVLTTDATGTVIWENRSNFTGTSALPAYDATTANKVLSVNAAGSLVWSATSPGGISSITGMGITSTTAGGVATLTLGAITPTSIATTGTATINGVLTLGSVGSTYSLPTTRPLLNQILKADASGNLIWSADQTGAPGTNPSFAPNVAGDVTGSDTDLDSSIAPTLTIGNGKVTSAKIANGAIQTTHLSAMGATTTGQVLRWNGTTTSWEAGTASGGGVQVYASGNALIKATGAGVTYSHTAGASSATVTVPNGVRLEYVRINETLANVGGGADFDINIVDQNGDVNNDLATFMPPTINVIDSYAATGNATVANFYHYTQDVSPTPYIKITGCTGGTLSLRISGVDNYTKFTVVMSY